MISVKAAPSSVATSSAAAMSARPEAALARAGIDHQGEQPDDPVVVLEARQGVQGDEAEDDAVALRDEDLRMVGREALEPLDDVARTGGIALVGEQRGDGLRVGWRWRGGWSGRRS